MGYHVDKIPKGIYGDISKIEEELCELKDAIQQKIKIMELVELSDIIGAIEGYINKNHPNISLYDLFDMAKVTQKAFIDGTRK